MIDRRLLGTWQSDRTKTFLHYRPKAGMSPQKIRRLRLMFGKLVVRWARKNYYWELDGIRSSEAYEIVASDLYSVVIRHNDAVFGEGCLTQIHFEGNYYWMALTGGQIIEWFRKIN